MTTATTSRGGGPGTRSVLLGLTLWLGATGAAAAPPQTTQPPLDEPPPPPDGAPTPGLLELTDELGPPPPPPDPKSSKADDETAKDGKDKPKRRKRKKKKKKEKKEKEEKEKKEKEEKKEEKKEQRNRAKRDQPPRREIPRQCLDACESRGRCTARGTHCIATHSVDCASSQLCVQTGRCSAEGGACIATSELDCRRSVDCANHDRCSLDSGAERCTDGRRRRSGGAIAGGIVMTSIGGLGVLGGGMGVALADRDDTKRTAGIVTGLGAALVAGGIPVIVWGARKVGPEKPAKEPPASLSVSPGGASFRMPF